MEVQTMTVDLRSGGFREPRLTDYITKSTAVRPAPPGTTAPRWCAFLAQVTDGDADLQAYLQRVVGYCLTGSVREHVLFFVYGTGANGKSVYVNTISGMLGDYAVNINTEMLMTSTFSSTSRSMSSFKCW